MVLPEETDHDIAQKAEPGGLGHGDERKDGGTLKTVSSWSGGFRLDYGVTLVLLLCVAFWAALVYGFAQLIG